MGDAYTERGIARQAVQAIREFQEAKNKFIQELHQVTLILRFLYTCFFEPRTILSIQKSIVKIRVLLVSISSSLFFVLPLQLLLPQRPTTAVPHQALLEMDIISILTSPLVNDPVAGVQSLSIQCLASVTRGTGGSGLALCRNGALHNVLAALDHPNKNVQCDANILLQASKDTAISGTLHYAPSSCSEHRP